jgi:uncharacterized coiled-coil DUF342 family protein
MENLNKYTPTELLKMINDTKEKHDILKREIINLTYDVEELEKKINEKINTLSDSEKEYIDLIEELNNRDLIK